jgi:hypothetical protein
MLWVRLLLVLVLACSALQCGCEHRMAVDGRSDQLYAEAKGALESEGFRPLPRGSNYMGAKGSSQADGRLQFLFYADSVIPTVVEVRIEPLSEAVMVSATQSARSGANAQLDGPHSVAVSAWSSLTYSPDLWISDLAVGVLRRAYLLSGNTR